MIVNIVSGKPLPNSSARLLKFSYAASPNTDNNNSNNNNNNNNTNNSNNNNNNNN